MRKKKKTDKRETEGLQRMEGGLNMWGRIPNACVWLRARQTKKGSKWNTGREYTSVCACLCMLCGRKSLSLQTTQQQTRSAGHQTSGVTTALTASHRGEAKIYTGYRQHIHKTELAGLINRNPCGIYQLFRYWPFVSCCDRSKTTTWMNTRGDANVQ